MFALVSARAQDGLKIKWSLIDSIPLTQNGVWTADILGNRYTCENGIMNKFDSSGVKVFSQSIKAFGGMSSLSVINTMKLVYFSEEQQLLCYLDNTLSQNENCIRLQDRGITYATVTSSSDRSNKMWVYDEINSQLVLIDLESDKQKPEIIENISSFVGISDELYMIERGGRLYLSNPASGIFIFDIYGTFLDRVAVTGVRSIDADENGVYYINTNGQIGFISGRTNHHLKSELPKADCLEIIVRGKLLYIRTSNFVYKYSVEMTD